MIKSWQTSNRDLCTNVNIINIALEYSSANLESEMLIRKMNKKRLNRFFILINYL